MQKFLIEVPHEAAAIPCLRAVEQFLDLGSHLLDNSDWGCTDGVHKLWVLIEAENKNQAKMTLPPMFRKEAFVVGLNRFSNQDIEKAHKNKKEEMSR